MKDAKHWQLDKPLKGSRAGVIAAISKTAIPVSLQAFVKEQIDALPAEFTGCSVTAVNTVLPNGLSNTHITVAPEHIV